MKHLLAILLVLSSTLGFAQEGYEIKVTLKPFRNQYIFLGHYNNKQLPVIDSAKLNDKSEAVFKGSKKLGGGIYVIAYPDKAHIIEFLLDKNQKFSIIADTANVSNVSFLNSPENTAFRAYQNRMNEFGRQIDLINARGAAAKTAGDSAAISKAVDSINGEVKKYRNDLMKKEPANMLTTLLKWMRDPEVPQNDPAAKTDSMFAYKYYKKHYWDDIYFYDDRLTRTPFFEDKLDRYLNQMIYPAADSVIKEIDWMMGYATASGTMQQFLLLKFINRYYNQRYMWEDKIFVHLFEKYISNKNYSWMSESGRKLITDRAYNLMSNVLGNPAPEVELVDLKGNKTSLYSVKSPYVLVTIWDPTCGHCKETLPKIDSAYRAKWKADGLKIFALAKETEGKKDDWFNFIRTNKLEDWVHVYYSKEDERARISANIPGYSQLFDVQTFPTLYLLDKDKRIIAKKLGYEQMGEILEGMVKKDKKG